MGDGLPDSQPPGSSDHQLFYTYKKNDGHNLSLNAMQIHLFNFLNRTECTLHDCILSSPACPLIDFNNRKPQKTLNLKYVLIDRRGTAFNISKYLNFMLLFVWGMI